MKNLIDTLYFLWKNGNSIEKKLSAFQGFKENSTIEWKNQTTLSWSIVLKLLINFEIYNGERVRNIFRNLVLDNELLFSSENCYVTGFGKAGKSGEVMIYDLSHTTNIDQSKIKKTWQITSLPSNSKIIFVEDIIGTGRQSVGYIKEKLNQILLPSHKPYLLSLCATQQGINNIKDNTNFEVIHGVLLNEKNHQFYSPINDKFTINEKKKIAEVNKLLKNENAEEFDLGLLLAFYFSIPNNTMPIFWKHGYVYKDKNGVEKTWNALLPRRY
jgi:hypothetical protein